MSKLISSVIVVFIVLIITGCSRAIRPDMVIPDVSLGSKHYDSTIRVSVEGDEAAIPSEDLKMAIEELLRNHNLFKDVFQTNNADYLLVVSIDNLDEPGAGFNMEVYLTTTWQLFDAKTNNLVWQDVISTTAKKTLGDAFAGIKRLRLANEEAVRINLKRGVVELSRLDL